MDTLARFARLFLTARRGVIDLEENSCQIEAAPESDIRIYLESELSNRWGNSRRMERLMPADSRRKIIDSLTAKADGM
jgi:hypothetical protein